MVEAELGDGDIGQITHAIQNALRGPGATGQRIAVPVMTKSTTREPETVDDVVVEDEQEQEQVEAASLPVRQRRPRKPAPTPKVIEIDLTAEPSLASFAAKYDPKSHHHRYLVIAAWLHQHRQLEVITVDHVYTCYRSLGWPSSIADFSQPLRTFKFKQFFTSPEKGKYAINHLGLAQVNKHDSGDE